MSEQLEIRAQDRVLVIAPHPDDESIGTGGLLQAARAAGAAAHVLVLTDGDNNPWPQRWIEKRWHIGAAERARWGARRRAEAQAALRVLGIDLTQVRFLGLPDLGLTDRLMRADAALIETLRAELSAFAPTLIALPALTDRHPDHSAAHILVRCALARSSIAPRLLAFAVHGTASAGDLVLALDGAGRRAKHDAILAHATQMQFSRRRFLAFADGDEHYAAVGARVEHDELLSAKRDNSLLVVKIAPELKFGANVLFVAFDTAQGGARWLVRDERGKIAVRDCMRDTALRPAAATYGEGTTWLYLDLPADTGALTQGYVKVARAQPGWRVFDRYGWQPIRC